MSDHPANFVSTVRDHIVWKIIVCYWALCCKGRAAAWKVNDIAGVMFNQQEVDSGTTLTFSPSPALTLGTHWRTYSFLDIYLGAPAAPSKGPTPPGKTQHQIMVSKIIVNVGNLAFTNDGGTLGDIPLLDFTKCPKSACNAASAELINPVAADGSKTTTSGSRTQHS
ncbi:hypothetical protein AUEXF2481DRAFT_30636 [Aureobasidium subglaciale EXF-2481]|uniref:Uncharacterized protein n=1 Tax=Aureobasidium subglaciale (strain EXF-2481) TaxID=1043005 RepID=A0A074Y8J0_AURSE|nr:uncharacterized protein AUEXF2481DRAFT_30636 [Aureobasidium subglaciale EXF-2481]KEQ94088.1 hypothetical protein AUEXF2481DRAFT_30636 [Aureobasidium subglaciale EXF-2481]